MKLKMVLWLSLLLIFLSCGTEEGEGRMYEYIVRNDSNKKVVVKAYLRDLPEVGPKMTSFDLGQEIMRVFKDGSPPTPYSFGNFFGDTNDTRDSIVIIFEDQKLLSFIGECSDNTRNPLNFCVYNKEKETFKISTSDFENALPCDGTCE